ncbi:hypothetical protein ZWY2020_029013 [Hordeum vulgare]|nr:hypothetical protein ZWY2020_029013 [Hordeum vulgare]
MQVHTGLGRKPGGTIDAFECGIEQTVDSVYAMSKMFETEYQREFFCGLLTHELRLGYFKKWCRDNNLE